MAVTQTLDQPCLDTPMVDGKLVDSPIRTSGLDGQMQDVAIINTLVYDKPEVVQAEQTPVIVPID